MPKEAVIHVNGILLTNAQAMVVRIALADFEWDMTPGCLGDDEHGETMVRLYKERCNEVLALILK